MDTGANNSDGVGEPLGLGELLRVFREAASRRLGHPVRQSDVACALKRSVRWYRDLESGVLTRTFTRQELGTIGELLGLNRVQIRALSLAGNAGAFPNPLEAQESPRISDELRQLLEQQANPAYIVDAGWNILAVNGMMGELFPWSALPRANLMRWLLLSPEAREQHLNWQTDAEVCVRMLRAAAVDRPHDRDLRQLITDTNQDPAVHELWTRSAADFTDHYDGHLLRMSLPILDGQVTELITHVLHPAGLPGCRMTILSQRPAGNAANAPAKIT